LASAKLQHIQFLCCLKKSQLKVLYCHVISSMTKYQQASDVAAYQDTPRKGLYIPLKRASIYPSKGPLHYPQKGLYVPLKRASTYPSKGPSRTCSLLFKAGDALPQSHALLAFHLVRPLLQKGSCPARRMACYQGFQSSPLHRW